MGARSRIVPYLRLLVLLVPLALLLAGCRTDNPYDTLTDNGEVSGKIRDLFYPVFFVAVFVFVSVEGLLLYTIIRYRRRPGRDQLPVQTHGNTRLEIGWTIAPSLILAAIAIPTIRTIVDLSKEPAASENALHIDVIAHQFWWEFQYKDPSDPSKTVYVGNEAHIPTDRPIVASVTAQDVIHSFWVPQLFGKQDAVPNHSTDIHFKAKLPGRYQGECAEFCGPSHALMHFLMIAEPQDQFDQWLANQAKPPVQPSGQTSAVRGQQIFMGSACISCHAIEGTAAQGRVGPNLTHFGTRTTLGANRLENMPENVVRWIQNPSQFKPGAKMPAQGQQFGGTLSEDDIRAIVDYLESLK